MKKYERGESRPPTRGFSAPKGGILLGMNVVRSERQNFIWHGVAKTDGSGRDSPNGGNTYLITRNPLDKVNITWYKWPKVASVVSCNSGYGYACLSAKRTPFLLEKAYVRQWRTTRVFVTDGNGVEVQGLDMAGPRSGLATNQKGRHHDYNMARYRTSHRIIQ